MLNDINSDLLRSVQSNDFLPPVSRWTTFGGVFLVTSIVSAIALAAFTPYNVTVKAAATVRPTGELRIIQSATEGSVNKIAVKENQVVSKGTLIATLDDSQLQTKKSQLEGNIQQSQLQLLQIAAQIRALDAQRASESNLMNRTIISAIADLSRTQKEHQEKQITTSTEVKEAAASLELAKEELKRYHQLGSTGAIATLQIKEKEQAYKAALAGVERAKATLNPSNAPVAIANERIAQEKARGESTLATLNKEREELLQRQVEIKNQLYRDRKDLQQTRIDLTKTRIIAPESGTILKLELRNSGQVVTPGTSVAEIAPNNASLVVKARVAAQDIAKINVCQQQVLDCQQGKVQLRFSAYPYPDYGTLKGAVREISPDATTPENNSTNLAPYYEVVIQPETSVFTRSTRTYPIQAGMEVTADIISKEETILQFMLRKARLLTDL